MRHRTSYAALFTLSGSLASALTHAADSAPEAPTEIVLEAPRGHTVGGVPPLIEMSDSEIDSYGVDTLSDLVGVLRPLTRSTRSDQMAVVLINGRLAGQTEFDNLPREAIERVEVLPESVALQYGFSENQRVLNFVLREHYRTVPARLSDSGATEGGLQVRAADAELVRLEDEGRVTLLASDRDSAWLRQSERGIPLPDAAARTLVSGKTDAKVAGTVSHAFAHVSASLEGSLDVASTRALQGAADDRTLEQRTPETTGRLAMQLTGQLRRFVWDATAFYLHVNTRSSSDTGIADGVTLVDRTHAAFDAGNAQLSLSGIAGSLPAGAIVANAKIGYQYQGFATRRTPAGAPETRHSLVRSVRSGSVNANLPIASRDAGALSALGELAGTFNLAVDSVSDFGTLVSTSYGLDWTPVRKLHFNFIYTDHQTAPTAQQLRAPQINTPNLEVFDFISGRTADVTQIAGGNDALAATNDRLTTIGLALGPVLGKTTFSAHYERSHIHDAIGALPPTTADVELAFPERFVRDADGQLIGIDNRWVNFQREATDDLKWGLNVWIPLGQPIPHTPSNRVEVSLFDTWTIKDRTLIRGGVPELDLLDGAPSDITGGQPRHTVEARVLVYRNGFGASLNGQWRSATTVGSGDPAAPNPVAFSALGTVDLRIFAELGRMPLTRRWSWSAGTRLSLAVTNLFDRRQSVRDSAGVTPLALAPAFLDPAGRVLALSVRKVFQTGGGPPRAPR